MTVKETATTEEAQFVIQRLYLIDASFEAPAAAQTFQKSWNPVVNLELDVQHAHLQENAYEVVLTVTATVKNEGTIAFLSEVKQAGIFTIQSVPDQQLNHLLESFCPNILYPYARETITSLVLKGSFPQLVLAPINFDMRYMQKLQEAQHKQAVAANESESV